MAENKTKATDASVDAYLADVKVLEQLLKKSVAESKKQHG